MIGTNLVKNSICWLVARQGLLAEVLMGLSQAFDLREPRVQRHGRVGSILTEDMRVEAFNKFYYQWDDIRTGFHIDSSPLDSRCGLECR